MNLRDLAELSGLRKDGDFIVQYGQEILIASIIFLCGLIAVKFLLAWLRRTLPRFTENRYLISVAITGLDILLIVLVISVSLHYLGMKDVVIRRLLAAMALVAIGFVVLLKPYIPTLPFKVGNTLEVGSFFGKVEAITFTHVRLKTFDGKTLFIPNHMLFKTVITNYHHTPTRRVLVKVTIGYEDDLLKAKELMKRLMMEDARVLKKPAPSVYVADLADSGVRLSARCWVENLKYFKVKSDLMERVKLCFDGEGVSLAYPQMDVHLDRMTSCRRLPGHVEPGPRQASVPVSGLDTEEGPA